MPPAWGTYSTRALALLPRPRGREDRTGLQGEAAQGALPIQGQAVAGHQLPGHQHEDLVDVLGLLGRCLQDSQEAVFLSQGAGILKQNVPFFPHVTFVPWE